jgi:FKBP-type peptidyl-prolyl cis-trans isomerase
MRRYVIPALAAISLAACEDDSTSIERIPCDPLLTQIAGVTGDTIAGADGLQYLERRSGTGDAAASGQRVQVHYTLSLLNGSVLESSCVPQSPITFDTGQQSVIPGFEQGVLGMRAGGVRRIIVPPSLAYGNSPGHALQDDTLVFDLELLAAR